ncbi:MAG: hypothetical protein HKN76_13610 [Saprospiraceae bacterium]|nr:hypothetical protein [Saprospiraceae bacterium]
MQAATQPNPSQVNSQNQEQFLIVPIFFKKQIEAIIESKSPSYAFGFFYGTEQENYRIIKKIWPVNSVDRHGSEVKITRQDFENAKAITQGTNLKLLGCFFTSDNGGTSKAILSNNHPNSFSFIRLNEGHNGNVRTWSSSIRYKDSSSVVSQKVIC